MTQFLKNTEFLIVCHQIHKILRKISLYLIASILVFGTGELIFYFFHFPSPTNEYTRMGKKFKGRSVLTPITCPLNVKYSISFAGPSDKL